ncbi:MAG: MBL fold metallo-hydrolase [Microthrixaceae bacterium]
MTDTVRAPGSHPKQEQLPAEDDATEVAPGVVRIQLPIELPGLGHVNCYVLEDERGVTLVDPGLPGPDAHAELAKRLRRAGYPLERVHSVLVTHSHPDHFGGAGRLKVEQHCDVVAHEAFMTPFDQGDTLFDDDLLELVDVVETSDDAAVEADGPGSRRAAMFAEVLFGDGELPDLPGRRTPWGGEGMRPTDDELEHMRSWDSLSKQGLLSLTPTVRVRDDEVLRLGRSEWIVVHTPGHTGDHICLFDPVHGTLLSGDHVLPTITPHISGMTPQSDSLASFFDALQRVADIDGVTTVLPAHGLPFDDLPGRVEQILHHHEDRLALLEQIAQDLDDAPVQAYSRRLFRERSWGPMAESETYAHLEHLRLNGRMRAARDDEGMLRYRAVA